MNILEVLADLLRRKKPEQKKSHNSSPSEHSHSNQNDNHQHGATMALTAKPKVENSCKECGTFVWEPPEIVSIAFAQHPVPVQELMNEAWIFASLITSEIVVTAKCPHAAAIVRDAFIAATALLTVTADMRIRSYEDLAPKDVETRWLVNQNGNLLVDINCEFCGHMTWSPPEFINSLKDQKKRQQICAIAATMLHLVLDMTICFFHYPPSKQMLFSPAYTEARNLLLVLAITPIVHTAEEMKQCNMEDQTEFFRELFGDQ